eukprot:4861203-Amphidinium_carterae.1
MQWFILSQFCMAGEANIEEIALKWDLRFIPKEWEAPEWVRDLAEQADERPREQVGRNVWVDRRGAKPRRLLPHAACGEESAATIEHLWFLHQGLQ